MSKGRYYDAPTDIRLVDGVRVTRSAQRDHYTGTADALAASGLLARELFPGQPGQSLVKATLRANGAVKLQGESWWQVPGCMEIVRSASGMFTISLTVSREEATARAAAEEEAIAAVEDFAHWCRQQVPESLRTLAAQARVEWGWAAERHFADLDWISNIGARWVADNAPNHSPMQLFSALVLLEKARLFEIRADRKRVSDEDRADTLALVENIKWRPFGADDRKSKPRSPAARPAAKTRPHLRLVWSAGSASP